MAKRRKAIEEGHVNHERWLITYADLITLLMVFFIVMYSTSRADMNKFIQLSQSLKRAFNVEVLKGDVPTSINGENGSSTLASSFQEAIAQGSGIMFDSRMVSTIDELRQVLTRVPQPQAGSGTVELGTRRDGVVISLAGNVLFDSGKSELKTGGLILLDAVSERLRELPNEVRVEGHTDNVPIATPLYPSNWELSSARATTVGRYFVEHGGIDPKRIIAAGFGDNRPAAPNDTREGRARNRRVDIVILFPPAGGQAANAPSAPDAAAQTSRSGGTP